MKADSRKLATTLLLLGSVALAAPLQVTLSNNPTTCQPMTVSWDASSGTAPWTITIAPLGHVPASISIPAGYMSGNAWSYNWNVPGYASGVSSLIVAVSDSTGRSAGTSSLVKLTKSGSCSAPSENLDFIWYPPKSDPQQCSGWALTVQEDKGNLGLVLPADMLILPENNTPTRLRISDPKALSVDWTVNYPRGTRFAVAGYDVGKSGSGGVGGDIYTVVSGKSASCIGSIQKEAVAGLPAAATTASASASSSASTNASRMVTSKAAATGTPTSAAARTTSSHKATPTAVTDSTTTTAKKGNSGAVIGGAVVAVIGALAIVAIVFFLCRRRNQNLGPDEYGVYRNNEKQGGYFGGASASGLGARWGASTNQPGGISPFTGGRGAPWRRSHRASNLADDKGSVNMAEERKAIVARFNDGASSVGHSSSVSLHRGRDSLGGAPVTPVGLYGNVAPNVHSVVPDDALFPPPLPLSRSMVPGSPMMRDRSSSSFRSDPFKNPAPVPKFMASPSEPQHTSQQDPSSRPVRQDSADTLAEFPLPPSTAYSRGSLHAPQTKDLVRTPPTPNTRLPDSDPFVNPHSDVRDLTMNQVRPPAPVTSSIFDPYAHMSRLYSDDEAAHIRAALNNSRDDDATRIASPASFASSGIGPRYVDPKESAARFRNLESQLLTDRKKVVSSAYSDLSDDEGGLPYM